MGACLRSPVSAATLLGCQRRHYVDSVDRTVTIRSMEDPLEVLHFISEHAEDSSTATYEVALRNLGYLATREKYQAIVSDGRFHAILSTLASRLNDCDASLLSRIADASARFRSSTPELTDLAQRLAEVAVRREGAFTPRSLASLAIALAMRGVRDATTVEFVKAQAVQMIDDLEPAHCVLILEAMRRWGIFDRQLVDLIVERLLDEVDRFAGRDVVDCLKVVSQMGLARGFLLKRLCTLAFENLSQFSTHELVKMSYSLAKLRFLALSNVDDLVDAVRPEMHRLSPTQSSEMLSSLAMVHATHQADFSRSLVDQYMSGSQDLSRVALGSLVDFAWSLQSLELAGEFSTEFTAVLAEIFGRSPPQNRLPLMKLYDVICGLELQYQSLGVQVPPSWRAACDEADRYEMDRLESSRLHNEIVMRFDHLRGMANGTRWALRMQTGCTCGPYRVDLLDEDTKVCMDVEMISWPFARHAKHRRLEELGYKPIRLDYWAWRRARTEEDQHSFLQREVVNVLQDPDALLGK